jgi:hypothetical protein
VHVLFELVRAIDVETNINSAWPKRAVNRLQLLKRLDCIMHNVECCDHIKLRR